VFCGSEGKNRGSGIGALKVEIRTLGGGTQVVTHLRETEVGHSCGYGPVFINVRVTLAADLSQVGSDKRQIFAGSGSKKQVTLCRCL